MRNTPASLKALFLLAALVAALALSACGGGSDQGSADVGDLGPDPATMAPADAPFYAEAVVRPQAEMADNLDSALSKFGVDDPGGMIREALDSELASDPTSGGLTYTDDVEPWLGNRIGGFISDFDAKTQQVEGAVAIAVTDQDAAQAFIDKAAATANHKTSDESYQGVDYKLDATDNSAVGLSGDFIVAGTEDGFKQAIDASAGDSLAESDDASAARQDVPEDSIFSGYLDTAKVIDLIESSGALTGQQLQQFRDQVSKYANGPSEFWARVDGDSVTIAGSGPAPADGSEPTDLVSEFPSEAWLAFAGGGFQATLDQFKQGFQQGFQSSAPPGMNVDPLAVIEKATGLDVANDFDWVGNFGGFAEGTSVFGLGGGLVIESNDDDAASATVDKLEAALQKQPNLQISPTDTGFSLRAAGSPLGAEVAVQDGKFVLAAGGASVDDVLSPSETLGDSDRFGEATDALGSDATPSLFLDFQAVLSLIQSTGQVSSDPSYAQAKPYLDALDYFVAGGTTDGDRRTNSLVIGLREPDQSNSTSAAITP